MWDSIDHKKNSAVPFTPEFNTQEEERRARDARIREQAAPFKWHQLGGFGMFNTMGHRAGVDSVQTPRSEDQKPRGCEFKKRIPSCLLNRLTLSATMSALAALKTWTFLCACLIIIIFGMLLGLVGKYMT